MSDVMTVRHAEDVIRQVSGSPRLGREALDDTIGSSWSRCVNDYSLDPSQLYSPTVIDGNLLKDRQAQHDELIAIADAEMDSLYDQISGSGYALLLTDASGVILREKLDPTLRKQLRSAGLVQGADWSEKREGTNGIGTCIAEERSVIVHRTDHFRTRHLGLSCAGAPIRDPFGHLVAVLDASTVGSHNTRPGQMHTMALVNLSATLIEKCLFLRRHQNRIILRFHARPELVNLLHDGALALDDEGIVSAADATAVRLLSANDRGDLVGRPVSAIFDAPLNQIAAGTRAGREAILPVRDLRRGRRFFLSFHAPQRHITPLGSISPAAASARQKPAATDRPLDLEEIAGTDPMMQRNARSARRIARSGVSVLIQGATGAGKEVFARALHMASDRAKQNFVVVNCAAIPETLIDSELFGHEAGARTGVGKEGKRGKVLQSSGGTLFLDEIGDMPLSLQTKLLRVLEEHEIVPLGAEAPVAVDLRLICASHRKLHEMIERGEFREDLYYRLNGVTLELPSLQERTDKAELIRHFLSLETRDLQAAELAPDVFDCLMHYPWPGNIRELRNVLRTALAICEPPGVQMHDLPRELREYARNSRAPARITRSRGRENLLQAAERDALLRAAESNGWNMSHTATDLAMSRNTLYRKLKHHGIDIAEARGSHMR
tara:strand:- start:3939 stop:5933 length:1995 start_codon:yes stop_codon:yes gene_type:complete